MSVWERAAAARWREGVRTVAILRSSFAGAAEELEADPFERAAGGCMPCSGVWTKLYLESRNLGSEKGLGWGPTPPSGAVATGRSGAPHTPVGRPALQYVAIDIS